MIKSALYSAALLVLKVYWRVFKPVTHGVKIVMQDEMLGKVLLIRNTYGRADVWHLPGGGFNPKKESPEVAAQRELAEELGVFGARWQRLGDYQTTAQGKRDFVTILACPSTTGSMTLGPEVAHAEWVDLNAVGHSYKVYEVTKFALNLMRDQAHR